MKYTTLPAQFSLVSKDFANDLKSIEAVADWHKKQMALFVDKNKLVALLLKDEYYKPSTKDPALFNVDLDRSWHKNCKNKKFHKGDRILLVKSSNDKSGLILELVKHSDSIDWHHLKMPSNAHWSCKIIGEVEIDTRTETRAETKAN
jgi:hypothetical protein